MTDNFTPNVQIISFYPSDKVGLFIEDCSHFKKPKLRIALVPTDGGQTVEFFPDLAACRVIFGDLAELGQLREDALFKTINGKNGKIQACDFYATIGENGHRSLTIINMEDGIFLKVINKNGEKFTRGAPLSSFNARMVGQAVSEYIRQIPLRTVLAEATAARNKDRQASQDEKDGFGNGQQDSDFPG